MREIVIAAAALGLCLLADPWAHAQEKKDEPIAPTERVHLGAGSCASQACHGGGFPERMEYKAWATKDPHSNAVKVLGSKLGQRIGARLGIKPETSDRCLNCHGTTGVTLAASFDQADGVSCELCHGGAKQWLGAHVDESWRNQRPAWKERFGLRDLSTPRNRARLCASCHVGSVERPITHEIMAAGHPPLTFDAAKQMRDMHPHWKDEPDLSVKTWVEGLREGTVAELRRIARAARNRREWMEFSVFDCYSCHHPIYQGTAYEKREPRGRPGELPLDLATLHVFVRLTGDRDLRERCAPMLARVVGPQEDPRTLAGEAEKLAQVIDRLDLGAIHLESDPAKLAAIWLTRLRAWLLTDEEVARIPPHLMQQITYAIDALAADRTQPGYREAYAALLRSVQPGAAYEASASARLALSAIAAAGS